MFVTVDMAPVLNTVLVFVIVDMAPMLNTVLVFVTTLCLLLPLCSTLCLSLLTQPL